MALTILALVAIAGLLAYFLTKSLASKKALAGQLAVVQTELKKLQPIIDLNAEIERLGKSKSELQTETEAAEAKLKSYQFESDVVELGFYQSKFGLGDVLKYAEALDLTREAQKELIRQKKIFEKEGAKDFKDIAKLAVSAFNGEALGTIESIRYDNFEKSKEQMIATYEKINGLLAKSGFRISEKYLELKIKELALVHDYREEDHRAKEEQAEMKAAMRECRISS